MSEPKRLALYEFSSCPFCRRVRTFLAEIGEEVESRDVSREPEYLAELVRATGSQMVPCLRIEATDGDVQWLHESADIIEYLKHYFARDARE